MSHHKLHLSHWENGELHTKVIEFPENGYPWKLVEEFQKNHGTHEIKIYNPEGEIMEHIKSSQISESYA